MGTESWIALNVIRAILKITLCSTNEGVVSKETVVLRRWGSSIQKFDFINGVDNVNWPPYRDSKSWRWIRSDEGLTLETSAFRISERWPIYIINSVDKTKSLFNGKPVKI